MLGWRSRACRAVPASTASEPRNGFGIAALICGITGVVAGFVPLFFFVAGTLGLFLVNVLIWAAVSVGTGELIYFWPVWTAIPLVFALANRVAQGRRREP